MFNYLIQKLGGVHTLRSTSLKSFDLLRKNLDSIKDLTNMGMNTNVSRIVT